MSTVQEVRSGMEGAVAFATAIAQAERAGGAPCVGHGPRPLSDLR